MTRAKDISKITTAPVFSGLTYPTSDGSNGQVMQTNGSGTLSFTTVSGTTINNNADNRIITGSGSANTLEGEANLTFDGSTLALTGNLTVTGDLASSTNGTSNFRAGVNAGNSIASGGNYNTVIGDEAGTALTTGDNNVAIGFEALKTEDAHGNNVAVGYQTLKTQDAGADGFNTAVGYKSGTAITSGIKNNLIGGNAGLALTDADFNTAVGHSALATDTQGSRSTAIGYQALTTQNFSSATDSQNTAVGYNCGKSMTTGIRNTFVGHLCGEDFTDADFNTAMGHGALDADTKGNRTVAIGYNALSTQNFTTSTDSHNVAVGFGAGIAVNTGTLNTFVGSSAGGSNTSGYDNICIGRDSGLTGSSAGGSGMVTGYRNILIGNEGNLSATDGIHQICLGSHITGANSSFTFGNGGTDSRISVGATSITAPSDERYKEEITTSTAGLSFINDLRPVTFKWKKEKDIPTDHRSYVKDSDKRVMEKGEKVNHGFIAQEVKTAIDNHSEIKDGFDMWSADPNDGRQRLAPSELIPMLVKAIQELSAEVTALKGE